MSFCVLQSFNAFIVHQYMFFFLLYVFFILVQLICRVNCLYVSVTNTTAYATLVTEHIILTIYCIFIFLINVISDNTS